MKVNLFRRTPADDARDARSELAAVTAQLAAAQATIRGLGADLNIQRTLVANSEARERGLAASLERYARALTAESAEVARLNGELADATATPEQPGDDGAYWKAKWEQDRRNVTAMADELARLRAGRRWGG